MRLPMNVGLSLEIDADVYDKAPLLDELSRQMKEFFKEKSYGDGVKTLTVGVICVAPEALFFFRERCKYNKKQMLFEYDVQVDHGKAKTASGREWVGMIKTAILDSRSKFESGKVANFDRDAFFQDLHQFYRSGTC